MRLTMSKRSDDLLKERERLAELGGGEARIQKFC